MSRPDVRSPASPWRLLRAGAVVAAIVATAACTPTLDWREVRVEGDALTVLFPCKPDRRSRVVPLAGEPASMRMLTCAAGGDTFAASFLDVDDPARVPIVLQALQDITVANIDGAAPQSRPLVLRGATPSPLARRLAVTGRLPDGRRVVAHCAFFVHGLRVYQASVIGPAPDPETVSGFVAGLKLAT